MVEFRSLILPGSLHVIDVLALSGSLRAASTNSALLAALRANALSDFHLTLYDGLGSLPIFNPDDEGERTPPLAAALIDAVARADGIIVSCPEYAHGVPGGLKNALDWLVSRMPRSANRPCWSTPRHAR